MSKLKQVITLNNTCFTVVPDVEASRPNITCFASQLNNQALTGKEATVILVKLALTKDGKDCQLELQAIRDSAVVCQTLADTLIGLVGK